MRRPGSENQGGKATPPGLEAEDARQANRRRRWREREKEAERSRDPGFSRAGPAMSGVMKYL